MVRCCAGSQKYGMKLRKLLIGSAIALALATLGGFFFLRSIGMFSSAPIYQTEAGAIDGYDVVAYFNQGEALRGLPQWTQEYKGASWRFASQAHHQAFAAQPERYVPQFGGYCAFAVSQNYTAYSDPNAWTIVDGRLYLNIDQKVAEKWKADQRKLIQLAEQNWPAVLGGSD